jgi:hypothetical protein
MQLSIPFAAGSLGPPGSAFQPPGHDSEWHVRLRLKRWQRATTAAEPEPRQKNWGRPEGGPPSEQDHLQGRGGRVVQKQGEEGPGGRPDPEAVQLNRPNGWTERRKLLAQVACPSSSPPLGPAKPGFWFHSRPGLPGPEWWPLVDAPGVSSDARHWMTEGWPEHARTWCLTVPRGVPLQGGMPCRAGAPVGGWSSVPRDGVVIVVVGGGGGARFASHVHVLEEEPALSRRRSEAAKGFGRVHSTSPVQGDIVDERCELGPREIESGRHVCLDGG